MSDIGAVIPTTIQNKVIEDMTIEGKILSRINQTSYQGGLEIPISDINIIATWFASENKVSEEQKAEMNTKLTLVITCWKQGLRLITFCNCFIAFV